MTAGKLLRVITDKDIVIERSLVTVENGVFFVCKPEEFEAARLEGRQPVCIGFRSEYFLDLKNGRLQP